MKVVLDTNIVLDWLVFHDPRVALLQAAIAGKHVEVVTHATALDELRRVLTYPQFNLPVSKQQEIVARYGAQARIVTLPVADCFALPPGFPRCRDQDDQHFLALAFHECADGLVSKDNHLLELAKRVLKFGVTILSPEQLTDRLTKTHAP